MRNKKRLESALLAGAMVLGSMSMTAPVMAKSAKEDQHAATIMEEFENPSNISRGMFRFWVPDAAITEEELQREFQEIADAGFCGVEIAHVPYSRLEGDLAEDGWGTENWKEALKRVYTAAAAVDKAFQVDMTINTQWPPALDTVEPNDEAASSELSMTMQKITSVGATAMELPETRLSIDSGESYIFNDTFVAATVAKVKEVTDDGIVLDYDTMQDVSSTVKEDGVAFKAGIPDADDPATAALYEENGATIDASGWGDRAKLDDVQYNYTADLSAVEALEGYQASEGDEIQAGDYVLFNFYYRGTGNTITPNGLFGAVYGVTGKSFATTGIVLDEFSTSGVDALTEYWEENILDEELISMMKSYGGYVFEDSIESTTNTIFWNSTMRDSFKEHLGYDIAAYLPFIYSNVSTDVNITSDENNDGQYFEDVQKLQKIRYQEDHLKTLQNWAKETIGYGLRTQSYTHNGYLDQGLSAATVDEAEGETIEFGTDYDQFRTVSGGVHVAGKTMISDETMANGSPYTMTYKKAFSVVNAEYAAGVNRIMIHGYSYANTDNLGTDKDARDQWPGWTTFNSCAGDSWGSRNPNWNSIDVFANYVARTQAVLGSGQAKSDIAIMTPAFEDEHESLTGASNGNANDGSAYSALLDLGYTYEVLSEGVLQLDSCTAADGIICPEGPAYKAIVVDNLEDVELATLEKLEDFAEAGVKVYFAEKMPERLTGTVSAEEQKAFEETEAELKANENVAVVDDLTELVKDFEAADITPAASYNAADVRVSLREDTDGSKYYYIYNHGETAADFDITVEGTGTPYTMNALDGSVTPVACYEQADGQVKTHLELESGATIFLAVVNDGKKEEHAVSATGTVYVENGELYAKAEKTGKVTAVMSDGTHAEAVIDAVPEAVTLDDWSLSLESWGPDAEANKTNPTVSKKTTVEFDTVSLGAWSDITASQEQLDTMGVSAMNEVSGIGTYKTTFTLPEDYDAAAGSYVLSVTHGTDNISNVIVNGHTIHVIDPSSDQIDLGTYLQAGENTLEIEVTSTLINRIITEEADNPKSLTTILFFFNSRVSYGLMSAELTPYGVAKTTNIEKTVEELKVQIAELQKEIKIRKQALAAVAFALQKVSIRSAKSLHKGQVIVTVKKVSGADGYQFRYATNKKLKSAKTKTTKGTTAVIKKLTSKKYVYVQARALNKIGGKLVKTGYSKVKAVKVK